MKNYLSDLLSNRDDMQKLESQRSLLSKEISMVRELEALGSAMSSHPLNTLSQRFAIYKKKRDDVEMIKSILMEKAVEAERMMDDYLSFVDNANAGMINSALLEVKSNYATTATFSEFDLVKEFLESSNQGQTFLQGENLRKDLDLALMKQRTIVGKTLETLIQYFNIINFYPHDHIANHRFGKYSHWCRSLIENKSQDIVRQVAIAFQNSFGDAVIKDQLPENIIGFNCHLQTMVTETNYQRAQSLQRYHQLAEHLSVNRTFNIVKEEFHNFIRNEITTDATIDPLFFANELTKMTKRILSLELSTFSASVEHLPELVINERWYIDEIIIQTSFLAHISDIIFDSSLMKKNALLSNSLDCFKAVAHSLETFSCMKNDFQLKIIPQTLKAIISGDKSMLEMISDLSNVQNVMPFAELALQLQEDLHKCIQNPNQIGYSRASDFNEAYINMVTIYEAMTTDSVGRKIFLSINGMFAKLYNASKKALSFDKALGALPREWSEVSEIQQSKSLFISPIRASVSMTLEQIFLVKKVQTMIEFFSCCLQAAWAFKGSGVIVNLDLEFLSRPLKSFISDCLLKFVIGRASHSLSIMIGCVFDQNRDEQEIYNKCFSLEQMCYKTTANSNVSEKYFIELEENFRKEEAVEYFKKLSQRQIEYVKQLTSISSAHHWLHEDLFLAHPNILPPIPRATVLIQLQAFIQNISSLKSLIYKSHEELQQCTLIVLQRLKWASGANPMMNDLLIGFESISNANDEFFKKSQANAAMALKHCCSIFNFEMLRFKTPKAVISDQEFLNFLQQWENVCLAEKNVAHTVNAIEEALVELLDPEGKIEKAWINNVTSLIDDMINQVHSDIDAHEKGVSIIRDNLDLSAHKLRSFIASHHRISADIRNLLKSILKHDDCVQNKALKEYLLQYKAFIDNVTELHGNVLSKDFTDSMVKRTIEQVEGALSMINKIYYDLFAFEKILSTTLTERNQRRMMRNQSENFSIEYPGSPAKKGQ